jgi:lysozyme family protein
MDRGMTQASAFDRAFAMVVGIEGNYLSAEQATRQKDPGGETKFGLSKRANPDLDIASLTIEQAKGVYRRRYWEAVRGDELPYPLAAFVFDAAVNQGTDAAIRMLQKTLGLAPDGGRGGQTLAAARRLNREGQALFLADRALRYTATRNFELDGRGWLKRLFLNAMEA